MVVLTERQENRCCTSCCIFILSLVSFGLAIYFLVESASDERGEKIEIYNAAVQDWENTYRQQLLDSAFSVSTAAASVALVPDTSTEGPKDEEGVNKFSPLRYTLAQGNDLIPDQNFSSDALMAVNITATYQGSSTTVATLMLGTYALFSQESVFISKGGQAGASKCQIEFHGLYDPSGHRCFVFYQLESLCGQVSLNDQMEWTLDTSRGDFGCDPQMNWKPNTLKPLDAKEYPPTTHEGQQIPSGPVSFSGFDFSVRSAHDPMLQLRLLTEDSLTFGLTSSELLAVGICLIIIGLLLLVNPVLTVRKICRLRRQEKEQLEEQFTSIGLGGLPHSGPRNRGGPRSGDYAVNSDDDDDDNDDDVLADEEDLRRMEALARERVAAIGGERLATRLSERQRYAQPSSPSPLEGGEDARPWWATVGYYDGEEQQQQRPAGVEYVVDDGATTAEGQREGKNDERQPHEIELSTRH